MAKLNADGDPIYDPTDPNALDPSQSRNTLLNGLGDNVTTQPGPRDIAATNPIPTNPDGSQVGSGTPWAPGASQPSSAPAGYTWNSGMASYEASPGTPATGAQTTNPMESQIDALYRQAGITDGGRGSGFADRAYWLEHPSEIANGRLAADLAGTGSDQPTGTPGSGPWSNSGRSAGGPVASGLSATTQSAPTVPTPSTDPGVGQFNQQIRDMLTSQLQGLGAPETADSADIQPAISAYNNQSARDQQAERDQLAERFYASGGGTPLASGGFNTAVQQGMETAAGNRANFVGSTVQQANKDRRTQLGQMLNTAVTAGDTQSAQAIQQRIAEIDANLRQQGITNQSEQFGRSLSQQDQQYYDALAKQYADLESQNNRDTLLAGLRG